MTMTFLLLRPLSVFEETLGILSEQVGCGVSGITVFTPAMVKMLQIHAAAVAKL